ncbi:Ser-Thr-rich GPI-anchored membrane family protein [Bacteroidota bacterium]
MKARIYCILCILLFAPVALYPQEFKNIIAEVSDDEVIINYDLIYDDQDEKFRVAVYSSHNNYQTKLINVSNDVGNNITPGRGKRITWYYRNELPSDYEGNVQFRLVGEFMVAPEPEVKPIVFTSPITDAKIKTGKSVQLKWEGGVPEADYRLELYDGDDRKLDLKTIKNINQYVWPVPEKFDKGKAYRFRLTNLKDTEDLATSPTFRIKGKSTAAFIAVPVVVGAGIIYYLLSEKDGELEDLPPPIEPE